MPIAWRLRDGAVYKRFRLRCIYRRCRRRCSSSGDAYGDGGGCICAHAHRSLEQAPHVVKRIHDIAGVALGIGHVR